MLIRNAEILGLGLADLRLDGPRIGEIGRLEARADEQVLDARGGALLPGLHDHHIHLTALAARAGSVRCGPPQVSCPSELAAALDEPGTGWLRGIGYHESVMGLPDAGQLDRLVPHRPLRIQHRSGRMWLLNSPALAELLAKSPPPPGLERDASGFTGRLFDEDRWLRETLGSAPPDLAEISGELARFGITGITDMSPANDPAIAAHFAAQKSTGTLRQHCTLAGTLSLSEAEPAGWLLGPAKLHLHEAALPPFDEAVTFIAAGHERKRPVAVHCVTEVELVFALAAIETAGSLPGDRIEHASVAPPQLVERMAGLGLAVCVQPHFIAERGDQYLAEVEPRHIPDLYRLRSLMGGGITLAGGSDAPFGTADCWTAMRAAVSRSTGSGNVIGRDEALAPEEALALYLAEPNDLGRQRRIAVGEVADLCLLDRPWKSARDRLSSADVRATFISGSQIFPGDI